MTIPYNRNDGAVICCREGPYQWLSYQRFGQVAVLVFKLKSERLIAHKEEGVGTQH